MFKKEILGKLLFIFGVAALIGAVTDIGALLLPLHLGDVQWTYQITKALSGACLVPILGILAMIGGFYLISAKESKFVILFEKITASISALFAVFLIIITLLFSMSLNPVENQMVSNVKAQGENFKKQITEFAAKNPGIPREKINASFQKVDQTLVLQVNSLSKSFLKDNIKIFINIIAFIVAYILFSLILWKTAIITGKKLRYENFKN
jgi:hypothetical protein